MPLSCSCDFDGDYTWRYYSPLNYSTMPTRRARARCSSCGELIDHGATVAEFERDRPSRDDIEDKIYGEGGDIPLASYYLCERCADLYFSLSELGYECISPVEDMRELVSEYAAMREGE